MDASEPKRDAAASQPTAIRLDPARSLLEIRWQDGHVSRYDGAYLRLVCPCAGCRGHAPGEVEPPAWSQVEGVQVRGASAVGAYALRFELSDGHATGIYTFEWLRGHCPSTRPGVDATGRPTS